MKLIKDVGTIGFSDIVSAGLGAFFWFYLATLLPSEGYGEIQFFMSISGMAFGASMLAQSNAVTVYEAKKIELRKTLFLLSISGGLFSTLILFVIYQRFDIGLLIMGMIFGELTSGYFLGKKLFSKYATFIILQKVLMNVLAIGLYYVIGMNGIIFGIGISYLPTAWIIFKSFKNSTLNWNLLRKHGKFLINNYAIIINGSVKSNLDKILIMPIVGFGVLGNYAIAFQIYHVLMMFSNMAMRYSLPQNASGVDIKKFNIITIIVACLLSLIGIFIVPKIIPIYFPNYIESIEVIPIMSVAIIPNSISLIYLSKFLGREKSKFVLIANASSTAAYLILLSILVTITPLFGIGVSYLVSSIVNVSLLVLLYTTKIKNYD